MTETIRAPWTPAQVAALNAFQRSGGMHPFTCGGDHTPGSPTLVAREDGWHCPEPYGEPCDYRQDWAHAFMADPAAWPKSPFGERHGPTPQEMQAATQTTDAEAKLERIRAEVRMLCDCCLDNRERMGRIRAELGLDTDGYFRKDGEDQ